MSKTTVNAKFLQFKASGSTGDNTVTWDDWDGWNCTCEDYIYRHNSCDNYKCKHIKAVEEKILKVEL